MDVSGVAEGVDGEVDSFIWDPLVGSPAEASPNADSAAREPLPD